MTSRSSGSACGAVLTLRAACGAVLVASLVTFLLAGPASAAPSWPAVDAIFGREAKVLPPEVHRYGWPRSDIQATLNGVRLEPALALGQWAALVATGAGDQVLAMGDLVLLDAEVNPVITALQGGGIEVTAVHNHLLHESPHVTYVHFMAHGDALAVAKALQAAIATTATPAAPPAKAEPTAAELAAFKSVEVAIGRTGTPAGHVLQIGVPRAESIVDHGVAVPPTMGMANAMNFQLVGEKVAAAGDLVLIAAEVNPVIEQLRAHGVEVTALHSHMLDETPRLFFLHFWALDSPQKVGEALKAALARINTKPAA
jgi:biotin operon repressor